VKQDTVVAGGKHLDNKESVVKQDAVVAGGKHLDNNKSFFFNAADVSNRNLCCGEKKKYIE